MVYKAVITTVLIDKDDKEYDLRIDYENDAVTFYLDGEAVFHGDATFIFLLSRKLVEKAC